MSLNLLKLKDSVSGHYATSSQKLLYGFSFLCCVIKESLFVQNVTIKTVLMYRLVGYGPLKGYHQVIIRCVLLGLGYFSEDGKMEKCFCLASSVLS